MRLFTAIELPQALRDAVAAYARSVRASVPDGALRWVPPDNLHLTLVFLGSVPDDEVSGVVEALERAVRGTGPLRLELDGCGAFRTAAWVGVSGDVEALGSLVGRMQAELGREEERPFHAHVTFGRFRDPRRARRLQLPPCGPLGRFSASEVALVRSETLPEGARYTVLHRSPLVT